MEGWLYPLKSFRDRDGERVFCKIESVYKILRVILTKPDFQLQGYSDKSSVSASISTN